ncbi:ABC transporter ATP-binding protein [Brachybacterium huguangmaarense]|uniref:ABC transporter ATP-binding protein n=1 Tax=Brachybacterium huguangmaarense TaxID=1652028 RepID=A0ABY6FZV0_9MICO|nr:ABC transporter ATP-binding protein [Brachybacterium huguangmaarense]UYG16463.1 ABC transporter ATP-binding protein [Brachybacterium huguangmaarense]
MEQTSPPALEINSLVRSYGPVRAASGISLTAQRGAVTALLGPNGAGKTTTIHCATGLLKPDAGTVRVLGRDPWRASAELRSRVGVMIQDGGLASGAPALALLRYGASLYADPLDVDELAEHLGIDRFAGTLVRRLSGGQRQRLALALALVGRPELVFLDEPTAGMDASISRTVRRLMRSLARTGTAVVLTTHLMDDVEGLADHVVVINHGEVVASGSPEHVVASHRAADGTVHLTATASGIAPEKVGALEVDLRRAAARLGVSLDVTTGAADLETVLLDLTEPAEGPSAEVPSAEVPLADVPSAAREEVR